MKPSIQGTNTFIIIRAKGGTTWKAMGCVNSHDLSHTVETLELLCDNSATGLKQKSTAQRTVELSLKGMTLFYESSETAANWSPFDTEAAITSATELELAIINSDTGFAGALTSGNTGQKIVGIITKATRSGKTNSIGEWSFDVHANEYNPSYSIPA